MRIIQRHEWGARYPDGFRNAPVPASEAWLHHSVTAAPGDSLSEEYRAMRTLEDIGQNRFGGGISYTWCIPPSGRVYEGHSVWRQGAHTGGRNDIARAICLIGNYEDRQPADAQLDAAAWLLRHAKAKGWIRYAKLNGGHRDLKATACPGRKAYAQISEINRRAAAPTRTKEWWEMAIPDSELNRIAAAVWGARVADVTRPKVKGSWPTLAARSFLTWGRRDTRATYLALPELLNDQGAVTKVIRDEVAKVDNADPAVVEEAFYNALKRVLREGSDEGDPA